MVATFGNSLACGTGIGTAAVTEDSCCPGFKITGWVLCMGSAHVGWS